MSSVSYTHLDGVAFEGGKADNYTLEIGSGAFIPGFEDQLVGLAAGPEGEVKVTFPEQYAENLAGKDAMFKVKVLSLIHISRPSPSAASATASAARRSSRCTLPPSSPSRRSAAARSAARSCIRCV